MSRWSEFREEWRARKAGSKHAPKDFSKSAIELSGRLGHGTSRLWNHVEKSGAAYRDSFDRRLPPSLHISERDRIRAGDPIPRQERRPEDWKDGSSGERLTVDDILKAKQDGEPDDGPNDAGNESTQ